MIWALKRLGSEYFHKTFGERNRIERWFRKLKERTKRLYNKINTQLVKNIEEMAKAIELLHNITTQNRNLGKVIRTCQYLAGWVKILFVTYLPNTSRESFSFTVSAINRLLLSRNSL